MAFLRSFSRSLLALARASSHSTPVALPVLPHTAGPATPSLDSRRRLFPIPSGWYFGEILSLQSLRAFCEQSQLPSAALVKITSSYRCGSASSFQRNYHWDLVFGMILAGPTAIFVGLNMICAFADDASVAEVGTDNNQGQAFVTGLHRVEDGSVVSNEHTIKWRIFTDKGRDLFLKGKVDEAENFFQAALNEAKEGFGPRDPHVASSYNNLAELYRVRKAFEKAEPLYLEARSILEETYGADDIRVGAALHNHGQFYLAQMKLDQAQMSYERALKIEGRILGHGHPDYANTMYHLGKVMQLQGKEKDAETLVRESIRILEENGLGETTTCVRRMRYFSQILLNSNQLVEAQHLQRKILHILELSKGWDSLDTVIAAERLALNLQSLGNLAEAQDLLERCLEVRKKILPNNHIQIAANMLHLARLGLINSNRLRKLNITKAGAELDKAKLRVDSSIRIAKEALDYSRKNQNSRRGSSLPNGIVNDQHMALILLLQSLDFVGLLDVTKCELLEAGQECAFPVEAEVALRDCISIYREPSTRSLLNSPDVKAEYLSCLMRLGNLITDKVDSKELRDEVQQIEAELSPRRHRH